MENITNGTAIIYKEFAQNVNVARKMAEDFLESNETLEDVFETDNSFRFKIKYWTIH